MSYDQSNMWELTEPRQLMSAAFVCGSAHSTHGFYPHLFLDLEFPRLISY